MPFSLAHQLPINQKQPTISEKIMHTSNVSTTIKAFKELVQSGYSSNKSDLLLNLDAIQECFDRKDFENALSQEKQLSFSFHKSDEKAEKEFKFILKNQIINAHIEFLNDEAKEFNTLAFSLSPNNFQHDNNYSAIKQFGDSELHRFIREIGAAHIVLKDAIIHLFNLSIKRNEQIKLLKKDLADIIHP